MDMIEKVARAILKARFYDIEEESYNCDLELFWESLDEEHCHDALYEARAAIEAMQTPTAKMIEWGSTERTKSGGDDDVPHIFEAMIKAALEE
jgi:hypothetical protein